MNLIALDIGDSRIGIAFGDSKTKISTPICVCTSDDVLKKSKNFSCILDDYQPEKFIVGLPKSLDGSQNAQAEHVKEIAGKIKNLYNIEIEYVDERLSSKEAKSLLKEQGLSEKQMRGKIDSVAASLFLETYLASSKL